MKTIPEALKKLYVAMGGDEEDVADISLTPDMIEALVDVYEGGGGAGLPEVTVADNGDVLTVVNGEWGKAEAARELPTPTSADNFKYVRVVNGAYALLATSPEIMKVVYTEDPVAEKWECDHSFADIAAMFKAGKFVFAEIDIGGGQKALIPLAGYAVYNDEIIGLTFSSACAATVDSPLEISSGVIRHSNLTEEQIDVKTTIGYLSATNPNT